MAKPFGTVYGLYDPRNGELRYIGQTILSPNRRLSAHMSASNLKANRHSTSWLSELKGLGLKPDLKSLAEANSRDNLDALEIAIIAQAKEDGAYLTNHANGGAGISGHTLSYETRRKMSESRMGREVSPETRAKIGQANKGLTRSVSLKQLWATTKRRAKLKAEISKVGATAPIVVVSKIKPYVVRLIGQSHPNYRKEISTEDILLGLSEGLSRKQLASELGVTARFI